MQVAERESTRIAKQAATGPFLGRVEIPPLSLHVKIWPGGNDPPTPKGEAKLPSSSKNITDICQMSFPVISVEVGSQMEAAPFQ